MNPTSNNNDAAIAMLQEIFGTAIAHIVGGNPTAAENAAANMLGTAFGFFNGGVLFFGSILLTWVTVFGLTNTANDGQVLGKKWSTFYTPLRTFTASAFLIPSTSGYSMVQLAILLFVTWSVGFASNMWGKVVDYVVVTSVSEQAMRSVIDDRTFAQTAINALRMKVCADALTKGVNLTMGENMVNMQLRQPLRTQISTSGTTTTYTTYVEFVDPKLFDQNICGTLALTTTFKKPDTNSVAAMSVSASLQQQINDLQGDIGNIRFNAIMSLFTNSQMDALEKKIMAVADDPNGKISASEVQKELDQMRDQLLSNLRAEITPKVNALNGLTLEKFKKGGWVMAGSLHRELARVTDAVRLALTSDTAFSPGSNNLNGIMVPGDVANAIHGDMKRYEGLVAALVKKIGESNVTQDARSLPKLETGFTLDDFADGGTSVKSSIQHWVSYLPNKTVAGLTSILAEDGTDPVMQVKNLGDYMAGVGEVIYLTTLNLEVIANSLKAGADVIAQQPVVGVAMGPIKIGLEWISSWVGALMKPLAPFGLGVFTIMYAGYFLGIWLPMVPFFIFGLGVIGWLVQVIEALAAGALWMVMHLTPENNDSFIGSQQQGYLLLMSLFARPPLMILGLVASMAILTPAVRFINAGFITAFNVIQADSITGLLSVAGYFVVYCTIMVGVFMLVFSLPQTLPDRILRWIGAGISDLGEQGTMSRIESGASGQARTAMTAVAHKQAGLQSAAHAKEDRVIQSGIRDALKDMAGGGGSSRNSAPEGHTGPPL